MKSELETLVNIENYPLSDLDFQKQCKAELDKNGALLMENFLKTEAIEIVQREAEENRHLAFYTADKHNIFLTPPDPDFSIDHPRNRLVSSSKGCITTDQIPVDSALIKLYESEVFRSFLCIVLGETELHEYADPLSSINLHYADQGQELGWHYDNSSFAITLMIQAPERGGVFEYVKNVRDADKGEMNYSRSDAVLNGTVEPQKLLLQAGSLVLFRGRNSMHRVTPVEGDRTRLLVVLAYNTQPGVSLSASARMTFFGRLE